MAVIVNNCKYVGDGSLLLITVSMLVMAVCNNCKYCSPTYCKYVGDGSLLLITVSMLVMAVCC